MLVPCGLRLNVSLRLKWPGLSATPRAAFATASASARDGTPGASYRHSYLHASTESASERGAPHADGNQRAAPKAAAREQWSTCDAVPSPARRIRVDSSVPSSSTSVSRVMWASTPHGCPPSVEFPDPVAHRGQSDELRAQFGLDTMDTRRSASQCELEHQILTESACISFCDAVKCVLCSSHPDPLPEQCLALAISVTPSVMNIMKLHKRSLEVHEAACRLLRLFAVTRYVHRALVEYGAVQWVLDAMAQHEGSPIIQEHCLGFLRNMCVTPAALTSVIVGGGVDRVFHAMSACPESSVVQELACATLRNLAVDADTEVGIISRGGLRHIYNALDRHAFVEAVAVEACGALANLAVAASNKAAIVASNGVQRVCVCMETHAKSAAVQVQGCALIRNIAACYKHRLATVQAGAVSLIQAAMDQHVGSNQVQRAASRAVLNLSLCPSAKTLLRDAHGEERLRRAILLHPADFALRSVADAAIAKLQACGMHFVF